MLGYSVVLIDTDIGLRNLDVVMGLENRIIYNLVDVVEGNCRMKQALIRDKRYPNLYLLPSAQTRDKSSVNPGQMKKLVDDLREEFDYILLDCPAGIEQGFQNAIAGADRAIGSYYSGGIRYPGCRPYHRSSGGGTAWKTSDLIVNRDPYGYGAAGRYDVGR